MLLAVAQQFADKVPSGVVVAFPYILFGFLGLGIVALLIELGLELKRTRALEELIRKQQLLAEERDAFWHLAANYLRAPVTLIVGGAEALRESHITDGTAAISSLAGSLQIKVSQIMGKIETSTSLQAIKISKDRPAAEVTHKAAFVVPLIIVGLLTLVGDYLATGYRTLNLSPLGYVSQVIIFLVVGVALYWAVELLNRSKNTRKITEELYKQQSNELSSARHQLIEDTANSLTPDLIRLEGFLQTVPDAMAASAVGALSTIHQGVSRLQQIVSSFGLLIRLQEGTGEVTATPEASTVDLKGLLEEVKTSLMTDIAAKGMQLNIPDTSLVVATEPDLAKQVVGSILSNAVDYSPEGGVVTVEATKQSGSITMKVIDQGEGIDKKQLQHLFKPFVRTDGTSAMDMSHGGFGVNLYLDKLIMEQIGGTITATSVADKGTTITLDWPTPS